MDTPPLPRRKTIRLQNYDYSQNGAYFVTICTAHKRPLFGVVRRGDPCGRPPVPVYAELSEIGRIVESYLTEIPSHYPDVHLASYVHDPCADAKPTGTGRPVSGPYGGIGPVMP